MNAHVHERIAARLAGELDAAAQAAFDAHVAACPACADLLAEERRWFEVLGEAPGMAGDPAAADGPDAWPAIRARTFGGARGGLFYGRGAWSKTGIAAAALAAGLALAVVLPAGGGDRARADTVDAGSYWLDGGADTDFSGLWLAAATEEDPS